MNHVVIGIGSNLPDSKRIVKRCCEDIGSIVLSSLFSSCYQTVAVGTIPQADYHNCVGIIDTDSDYAEMRSVFKAMEKKEGRTPDGKLHGVVALDIDIVIWNDTVISPRDLTQDYIQKGLKQLTDR
ncbi:MAG: 2-amino-4-hydroxy-6-hydroxymethyldihydropteridine diphosphokinase [Bacteroidales bacterium]